MSNSNSSQHYQNLGAIASTWLLVDGCTCTELPLPPPQLLGAVTRGRGCGILQLQSSDTESHTPAQAPGNGRGRTKALTQCQAPCLICAPETGDMACSWTQAPHSPPPDSQD